MIATDKTIIVMWPVLRAIETHLLVIVYSNVAIYVSYMYWLYIVIFILDVVIATSYVGHTKFVNKMLLSLELIKQTMWKWNRLKSHKLKFILLPELAVAAMFMISNYYACMLTACTG